MTPALSDDLRGRALKASSDGHSVRQAAARLGVGIWTAIRWIARARLGERVKGRRRASRLDADEAFIVGLIADRRNITLNETMARLSGEWSVVIGHSGLRSWLRSHGWRFKKDRVAGGRSPPAK
ncbi:hypothetical protein ACFPN9_25705 [Bosea massiliensis]|uniref:Transposase n=1 Tax=Bosea massiliensis TaxID=151419 RepID=A0ABW0P7K3_9HYPH